MLAFSRCSFTIGIFFFCISFVFRSVGIASVTLCTALCLSFCVHSVLYQWSCFFSQDRTCELFTSEGRCVFWCFGFCLVLFFFFPQRGDTQLNHCFPTTFLAQLLLGSVLKFSVFLRVLQLNKKICGMFNSHGIFLMNSIYQQLSCLQLTYSVTCSLVVHIFINSLWCLSYA